MRIVKPWIPAILWSGLILFASSDLFSSESTGTAIRTLFGIEIPYWLHVSLRKLAHVVTYGILGTLAWRADRRWVVVLATVVAVAITDELLQTRAARRSGSLVDVGIDLVGGTIAWIALKSHSLRVAKSQRDRSHGL